MKRALVVLTLAGVIWAAPGIKRASMIAVEKSFDKRIEAIADDPYILTGFTRGVYLESYGAVFTAEVNLAIGAPQSPFNPVITKQDIERIRAKKLERFPILRKTMREALLDAASSLDDVPSSEQIVVGVSLLYRGDENTAGMPSQILMQGERGKLVQARLGRVAADSVVKVREF